jgi:CubicO group peptidase (beta-lactamase class C family)
MFIAMAAMILTEREQLKLDQKPSAYLSELSALDDGITLHHLLSHTSGIHDVYEVPDLRFEMQRLKHEQGSLLTYLAKLPQDFAPGEKWSYSSSGYLLMGYIMERVTGLAYRDLMRRYVLDPLGMADTGLDNPHIVNPGRAYGHEVTDGKILNAENDRLSDFDGPGELYSTVRDLKKWCDAIFTAPLVSPQTLALTLTPYTEAFPPYHYGYGWFVAPRFRMHGGGTQGFLSHLKQYPAQKVSVIQLFNSDHEGAQTIISAIEPLILGQD